MLLWNTTIVIFTAVAFYRFWSWPPRLIFFVFAFFVGCYGTAARDWNTLQGDPDATSDALHEASRDMASPITILVGFIIYSFFRS
jgi:hypothetical protein